MPALDIFSSSAFTMVALTDAINKMFAVWTLFPSEAGACGLSGPWYVRSDDGYRRPA